MATITPSASPSVSTQFIDNPPNAKRTMQALRDLGYDSYASILDILDNSIDAMATHVSINIREQAGDIVITIEDDGVGMDEDTLSEALRLGSDTERESNNLGKFGMGLVTASIGLSKRVEILTREDGCPLLFGSFDLDEIYAQDKFFKELGVAPSAQFAQDHGTQVRLSKTDRITNKRPSDFGQNLRKKIGQAFRKFLMTGVVIEVNGVKADPYDPLMLHDTETQLALDMDIDVDGLGTAHIRAVELPDHGEAANKAAGINQDNSGFYIVRNNREIMAGTTLDLFRKHPGYIHFRAEVSFGGELDAALNTDVKKMTIHPSQSFLDKLRQATSGLITKTERDKKRRANEKRGALDHSAAEANIKNRATLLPKAHGKGLTEPRTRTKKAPSTSNPKGTPPSTRPHVLDIKTASGLKVVFNEADYGEAPFYVVKQEGRTIVITYNRAHPFWREISAYGDEAKVIALFDYLIFAMANSELMVPEQASVVKASVNSTLIGLLI